MQASTEQNRISKKEEESDVHPTQKNMASFVNILRPLLNILLLISKYKLLQVCNIKLG